MTGQQPAARDRAGAGAHRAAGRVLRQPQALPERRLLLGPDLPGDGLPGGHVHGALRHPAHRRLARPVGRDGARRRSRRSPGRARSTSARGRCATTSPIDGARTCNGRHDALGAPRRLRCVVASRVPALAAAASPAGQTRPGSTAARAFEHIRQLVATRPPPRPVRPAHERLAPVLVSRKALSASRPDRLRAGVCRPQTPLGTGEDGQRRRADPRGATPSGSLITEPLRHEAVPAVPLRRCRATADRARRCCSSSGACCGRIGRTHSLIELVFFDGEEATLDPDVDRHGPHLRQPALRRDRASATGSLADDHGRWCCSTWSADREPGPSRRETDSTRLADRPASGPRRHQLGHADSFMADGFRRRGRPQTVPRRRHRRSADIIDLDYSPWHTERGHARRGQRCAACGLVGDTFLGALPQIEARLRR